MTAIRFDNVWLLVGLVPWVLFCSWFYRQQRLTLDWIDDHVAQRFRSRLTIHRKSSLRLHVATLAAMGAMLIVAMSQPRWASPQTTNGGGRLVFVVDASASMSADDTGILGEDGASLSRFDAAKRLAEQIVARLDGWGFGLVSFSGSATFHLPVTSDRVLVDDGLHFLERHNFYSHSGSSLSSALDAVLRFTSGNEPGLQVVLVGDGELAEPESYDDALQALVARGIPVHGVALGSEQGQARVIYDYRDVIAKKDDPAVLREFTTRRVDAHLARISEQTGGSFRSYHGGGVESIVASIAETPVRVPIVDSEGATDLALPLLMVFLGLFVIDTLVYGYRVQPALAFFRLDAMARRAVPGGHPSPSKAKAAALSMLLWMSACDSASLRAHLENEQGIALDVLDQSRDAESHYLRSMAFDYRSEIPTMNLGRSKVLVEAFSEAHEYFEQSLEAAPRLYDAHFNDGVALYRWGESVRDPENCELARTRELWMQARRRFTEAGKLGDNALRSEVAMDNLRHIDTVLAEIERYIDEPPPECASPPPPAESNEPSEDESKSEPPPPPSNENEPENEDTTGAPPDSDEGSDSSPAQLPLSGEELARVRDWLGANRQSRREGGRYFRSSRAEQFPSESWKHPKRVVW